MIIRVPTILGQKNSRLFQDFFRTKCTKFQTSVRFFFYNLFNLNLLMEQCWYKMSHCQGKLLNICVQNSGLFPDILGVLLKFRTFSRLFANFVEIQDFFPSPDKHFEIQDFFQISRLGGNPGLCNLRFCIFVNDRDN